MNTRSLGLICMITSAIQLLDGVRWAVLKPTTNDTVSLIVAILMDVGCIGVLMALLALKATGSNRIFQILTFLPVSGLLADIISNFAQLVQLAGPDNTISIVGGLLTLAGMIVVGILTIASKRWSNWRKFSPLMAGLIFPIALIVKAITQLPGMITIFMGAAWMLLGYTVLISNLNVSQREVVAKPIIQS
jgi:hypothetical protein